MSRRLLSVARCALHGAACLPFDVAVAVAVWAVAFHPPQLVHSFVADALRCGCTRHTAVSTVRSHSAAHARVGTLRALMRRSPSGVCPLHCEVGALVHCKCNVMQLRCASMSNSALCGPNGWSESNPSTHARTHARTHACTLMHTRMHAHAHTHARTHTHACSCTHARTRACARARTHTRTQTASHPLHFVRVLGTAFFAAKRWGLRRHRIRARSMSVLCAASVLPQRRRRLSAQALPHMTDRRVSPGNAGGNFGADVSAERRGGVPTPLGRVPLSSRCEVGAALRWRARAHSLWLGCMSGRRPSGLHWVRESAERTLRRLLPRPSHPLGRPLPVAQPRAEGLCVVPCA